MLLSDVCCVHGRNSRTERPRKTKIGIEVAHVTRDSVSDTTFKVKRSKDQLVADVLDNMPEQVPPGV